MAGKKSNLTGCAALTAAAAIWGSSFVVLKDTLAVVPVLWVLVIRFTLATLILLAFSARRLRSLNRRTLRDGAVLGVLLYLGYVLQTFGLTMTTPGKNAFLTSVHCVAVPFLCWIFKKKRPDGWNIAAAFICIAGVGLVSLSGGSLRLSTGDGLTLAGGIVYAFQMLLLAEAARRDDTLALTLVETAVTAVLALVSAPLSGPAPARIPSGSLLALAYLTVMCTAFCYFLQAWGQERTSPAEASVLLALESVFSVAFSLALGRETMTLRLGCGFALIFLAVLASETKFGFGRTKARAADAP